MMDKGKVLGMVVFVSNQTVECHQATDLPHFRNAVCQRCTHPEDVAVVDAWQAIVCPDKSGNTYHMQFPVCRAVKTPDTEILVLEQPRLWHLNPAFPLWSRPAAPPACCHRQPQSALCRSSDLPYIYLPLQGWQRLPGRSLTLYILLSSLAGDVLLVQHIVNGLILLLCEKGIEPRKCIQGKTDLEQSPQ